MERKLNYSVAIRTLGMAGNKYQTLLNCLKNQTISPQKILVYIAKGYDIPKESIGIEQYVYVEKGMVAQRALKYNEIDTEYILFLDDDMYFPNNFVEQLYDYLVMYDADIISPDVYPNAERPTLGKIMMLISGRMLPRKDDGKWGYKVMRNSGYSYNCNPKAKVYLSQTNAGSCFLCKKETFLRINFDEEIWMDKLKYALGDDQVMYYKMYLCGFKQLTWFYSGIKHLDAGTSTLNDEKEKMLVYSDFRFKTIFWHRFIFMPDSSFISRTWSFLCLLYILSFTLLISLIKFNRTMFSLKLKAIIDAINFIKSESYRNLPLIKKNLK